MIQLEDFYSNLVWFGKFVCQEQISNWKLSIVKRGMSDCPNNDGKKLAFQKDHVKYLKVFYCNFVLLKKFENQRLLFFLFKIWWIYSLNRGETMIILSLIAEILGCFLYFILAFKVAWEILSVKAHFVKSVRIRSYSGQIFPAFGLDMDQKNSKYGHFLCSEFSITEVGDP